MEKIAYFDYCAVIILAIVINATLVRRMIYGRLNQFFLSLVFLCMLTTLADIGCVWLDNMGVGNLTGKYIFHTAYLVLHSMLPPVYIIYLTIQTDTIHQLKRSILQKLILCIPMGVVLILTVVNVFTPVMFDFDSQDTYYHGDFFWILYGVALFYVGAGLIYLWLKRVTLSRKRLLALAAIFPLMIIALLLQMKLKVVMLEMFANACGILVVNMIIQRAEERIDSEIGIQKLSAYAFDIKRGYQTQKPMHIIMINIVNFKSLQEMLGYEATVDLKKAISKKMRALDKHYNLHGELYYIGDGQFRIVVDELSFSKVDDVANKMNAFMKKDLQLNQMNLNLVSRICVVKCPEDIADLDSLMAFGADLNEKPYNGEVLYASDQYKKEYYDIMKDIDQIIESALANHKFFVYYQPIYSVKENKFHSAEALLRLKDEKYGFISPEIFITAAEKSGAIYKIGDFVLEEVCKFIASEEFRKLGLDYIEINLSVVQCMQNNLANQILEMLAKYNVRPEQINLEITETAASYSQKTMLENLRVLCEAGVHFSLDDFGTGYSNMKRIASLPLYLVKLDKSFTDVEDNPRMMIVLENTIQMIKAMNLQIVVEGVETENVVKRFADWECEYIQGYYYSRPIPQDEFIEFIKQNMSQVDG